MEVYSDGYMVGFFEEPSTFGGHSDIGYLLRTLSARGRLPRRSRVEVIEAGDGLKTFEANANPEANFVLDIARGIPEDGIPFDADSITTLASISLPKHYID